MKKLIIFSFAIAAFGMTACKANRTCTCTTTIEGPGGTTTATSDSTLIDVTKGEIKDYCKNKNDKYTAGLETITISCVY